MNRVFLIATFAGAVSLLPSAAIAQDHGTHVYTDTAHGDKHEWNAKEDEAWKHYREEHHIKQEEFAKLKRKQQEDYWKWRHDHP
jgi:hypothetical protein